MKKMALVFAVAAMMVMASCGSSAAANKMADEMCAAMEKYDYDDPMSIIDAANDVNVISKKSEEYGTVTEGQLKKAMMKKCPEGWKKFDSLKGK